MASLIWTEKAHISLGQLATGNIALGSRMGSVKSAHRRAGKVYCYDFVIMTEFFHQITRDKIYQ